MGSKKFQLSCLKSNAASASSSSSSFSSRYPSMPKKFRRGRPQQENAKGDVEASAAAVEEEMRMSTFSVVGMACSACAGSVEKAIKRLPGIHEAGIDVLNNRARVVFYPAYVYVSFPNS